MLPPSENRVSQYGIGRCRSAAIFPIMEEVVPHQEIQMQVIDL
jgi:hypothetical protein